ncbi:MAG: NAD-dependent epimerase/dehydratase family protein [Actinomycetota bacterium]
MKVLLFGGTRFMGRYVLRALKEIGAEVTIANRGTREPNEGSINVVCDRTQPDALDQFKDSNFDVVIDFSAYSSEWVETAGNFFKGKISQYIFISSGAVYSTSEIFPITEDFPLGPPHPFAPYAFEKNRSEAFLRDFSAKGFFKTVSCRLPFVMGPENYEDRESFVFRRLLANQPILLANGGHAIHSFIYAGDVADALVALIRSSDKVNGLGLNIAVPEATTSAGFVQLAAKVSGKEPRIVSYNPSEYDLDVMNFDLKNVTFPFPALNAFLGSEKIHELASFAPKENLESMLKIYFDWWTALPSQETKEYPLEQRILSALNLA